MSEEQEDLVPWLPGMAAVSPDGRRWRRTAGGQWWPDGTVDPHEALTPCKPPLPLKPDFTDIGTALTIQWIANQAQVMGIDDGEPEAANANDYDAPVPVIQRLEPDDG